MFRRSVQAAAAALFACLLLVLPSRPLAAQTPLPATPPTDTPATEAAAPTDTVAPDSVSLLVPLTGVTAVGAGGRHTCALTTAGGVKCWGRDVEGQLGDGTTGSPSNRPTPADVVGLTSGVTAIAAGDRHTCALTTAGGVKCWGNDFYEQLGDGTVALPLSQPTPTDVVGLTSGVTAITAGESHSCALTATGSVKCWGRDEFGQLGDGTLQSPLSQPTPSDVVGLTSGVTAIATGDRHTCALTTEGGVKCWGQDEFAQLGDGTVSLPNLQPTPDDVVGLSAGVTAIAAGFLHTCALTTAGGVKCWGVDSQGQLGDGTDGLPIRQPTPADVVGLSFGVTAIAVGSSHTCALTTAGGVKCWGWDENAQLGDGAAGSPVDNPSPVDVVAPATCYRLTTAGAGGPAPTATPDRTTGCPLGHYLPAAAVTLNASPTADQRVQGWSAPVNVLPGATYAVFLMPAADRTVTATYGACHLLTLTHAGNGQAPRATPDRSDGCVAGRYGSGQGVVLVALPNAGQRVQAWSGAAATPASGLAVNTLTMPNAAATVSVAYQACLTVTATKQGEGALPAPQAVNSLGCLEGLFVQGEQVPVAATPASGWRVAGWTGTLNNSSTATTNVVQVSAAGATVGVIYARTEALPNASYLPVVVR